MRAAVFGTGFWARSAHVPALRAIPNVELVACVGRTMDRATEFARSTGIPQAFDSLARLLEGTDRPDLLVIAGPDDLHPEATRAALAAGVAIFCEKPLANEAATAIAMAADAERAGVPSTVGYSFRYGPAIQALYRDVRGGRLGDPWLIELSEYNAQFHPASGKPMNWKGDPAHAKAGALYEYASHVVDLAGWLVGPVTAVSADFIRVLPEARLDDIATLQLRFGGPAIGVLIAGWVLSGSIPGIRIRLHGSKGLAEVEMSQTVRGGQAYRRYGLDGAVREDVELESLGEATSAYVRRHLSDFVALMNGVTSHYVGTLPTLTDGARVQQVLEAALAATDHWVRVKEEMAR